MNVELIIKEELEDQFGRPPPPPPQPEDLEIAEDNGVSDNAGKMINVERVVKQEFEIDEEKGQDVPANPSPSHSVTSNSSSSNNGEFSAPSSRILTVWVIPGFFRCRPRGRPPSPFRPFVGFCRHSESKKKKPSH